MTARGDSPNLLTTPSVSTTCPAELQTPPHPIMHRAAGLVQFCYSWVCLRSDRVLTTNEPWKRIKSTSSRRTRDACLVRFWCAPETNSSAVQPNYMRRVWTVIIRGGGGSSGTSCSDSWSTLFPKLIILYILTKIVSMLFVYSMNLCNAILKIWMNLHRFQIKLWLSLSDQYHDAALSQFAILLHMAIFSYTFKIKCILCKMPLFLLYKQATFYNKCSSIRKFTDNSYGFKFFPQSYWLLLMMIS